MAKKTKKKTTDTIKRFIPIFVGCFVLFGILLFISLQKQVTLAAKKTIRTIPNHKHHSVCGINAPNHARCHAHVITDDNGTPLAGTTPPSSALGPLQFHTAYNLPCTPGGIINAVCQTPVSFGPIIAIVDAYRSSTIENDLNVYNAQYGLPSCTQANGCFQIVNENGGSTQPTTTDSGWAFETSLDVEVAHAMCQTCKILLVEANSSSLADLATANNTAANLGAVAISNSYGANEWSSETAWDPYFNHPGVAVTASTGDNGYGTSFPAVSPNVIAVGGTSLQLFTDNTYASESVWNGAGSGCSLYESAQSWQTSLLNWSQTGCLAKRGMADVSADADPNTGAAVYDSTPYSGSAGWWQVGGTSLSSPIIASIYALANVNNPGINIASIPYNNPAGFHDVISGSNGVCGTIMCTGVSGYDGPTGLGSPNGVSGFLPLTLSPMPTNTPTATLTPVPTNTPTPNDTTPPTVSITFPSNGSSVPKRTNITVTATASDNIGVTKVQFYRNNSLQCIRTAAPYSCSMYTANSRNVSVTYRATAYDAANNTSGASVTVRTQ